ncbi:MAG: energy coupling factor transporter S component ThiW [Anaerococcus sp.]
MRNKITLKKMVLMAFFVAIGVVISPILRVHGFAPTQHLVNIVCSVFLGPWYSLVCALSIGILRMMFFAITPLAITGGIFGAFLSGLFYRKFHENIIAACFGEIIGTGIIGSMISFPVMKFVAGDAKVALFTYTPSFLAATIIGSIAAFSFLKVLDKNKTLEKMKERLDG